MERWAESPPLNIKQEKIDEKDEYIFKKYRKLDFMNTFIIICKISYQYINNFETKSKLVRNIIGSVLGNLIYETSNIQDMREILKDLNEKNYNELIMWINDRRKGSVWINGTWIADMANHILENNDEMGLIEGTPEAWKLSYRDYAKYEFALGSGSSFNDVESLIARGVSRTTLCNMLYGFIMVRLLIDAFMNDKNDQLYLNWYEDRDLFEGSSRATRFFDGVILLDDKDMNDPWLLKCISIVHNPLDAIESIDSKLDDIGMNKCILFIPMFPSMNALRYSVYVYAEKRRKIIILYLQDLYRMIKMRPEEIENYIAKKMI